MPRCLVILLAVVMGRAFFADFVFAEPRAIRHPQTPEAIATNALPENPAPAPVATDRPNDRLVTLEELYGIAIYTKQADLDKYFVPWRTGQPASPEDIDTYKRILASELLLYPTEMIKLAGLQTIILCANLTLHDSRGTREATGCYDSANKVIYLNVTLMNRSTWYARLLIHHELFHSFDDFPREKAPNDDWRKLNDPAFCYRSECGTWPIDVGSMSITHPAPGFLTTHGMLDVREDKAELFSALIMRPWLVDELAFVDIQINNKTEYLRTFINILCERSRVDAEDFWQKAKKIAADRNDFPVHGIIPSDQVDGSRVESPLTFEVVDPPQAPPRPAIPIEIRFHNKPQAPEWPNHVPTRGAMLVVSGLQTNDLAELLLNGLVSARRPSAGAAVAFQLALRPGPYIVQVIVRRQGNALPSVVQSFEAVDPPQAPQIRLQSKSAIRQPDGRYRLLEDKLEFQVFGVLRGDKIHIQPSKGKEVTVPVTNDIMQTVSWSSSIKGEQRLSVSIARTVLANPVSEIAVCRDETPDCCLDSLEVYPLQPPRNAGSSDVTVHKRIISKKVPSEKRSSDKRPSETTETMLTAPPIDVPRLAVRRLPMTKREVIETAAHDRADRRALLAGGTDATASQAAHPPKTSKKDWQDHRFDAPARFALTGFSQGGCSLEQEGAVIYEGMQFAFNKEDGAYTVRFVAGVPAMPVTLRLGLVLKVGCCGQYTLTLPPISLPEREDRRHAEEGLYLVQHTGYLPALQDEVEVQVIRRVGTARFGFGLDVP